MDQLVKNLNAIFSFTGKKSFLDAFQCTSKAPAVLLIGFALTPTSFLFMPTSEISATSTKRNIMSALTLTIPTDQTASNASVLLHQGSHVSRRFALRHLCQKKVIDVFLAQHQENVALDSTAKSQLEIRAVRYGARKMRNVSE